MPNSDDNTKPTPAGGWGAVSNHSTVMTDGEGNFYAPGVGLVTIPTQKQKPEQEPTAKLELNQS